MTAPTRRRLLSTMAQITAVAVGSPAVLHATEGSGDLAPYARFFAGDEPPSPLPPTEKNILGPYFRPGALYRAKVCPPLVAGMVVVIAGRVLAADTGRPLPAATLDIWHADHQGRYDNDDPKRPPGPEVMINRARLIADEQGRYEFESILPGNYQIGPGQWRPRHIHYRVRAAGHRELVTQLYFRGEAHNDTDAFIRPSLIIDLKEQRAAGGTFKQGTFDIVLARG